MTVSNEEIIQSLRETERSIVENLQNANKLLDIRKAALNKEYHKDIRVASIHCLRRVFLELADHDLIQKGKKDFYGSTKSVSQKSTNNKKIYVWFTQQYQEFQQLLCRFLSDQTITWSHALSIRTYMELLKIDHKIYQNTVPLEYLVPETNFALASFRQFLETLIQLPFEIDVDLLIMLKDEVFNYRDCLFFGFYLLDILLAEYKEESSALQTEKNVFATNDTSKQQQETFERKEQNFLRKKKNALDLLRMMPLTKEMFDVEQEDSTELYWISFPTGLSNGGMEEGDDSDSDEEINREKHRIEQQQLTAQQLKKKKRKFTAATTDMTMGGEKKKAKKTFAQQLQEYSSIQRLFSKVWLLLLSLTPWSIKEHQILLTHLSTYLMKQLKNPLLLADYLIECYQFGGMIAILSLENLIILIVEYNFDYPQFFLSLYELCNLVMIQSKYAYKYLQLLSYCLQSTNIPEYLIFSFLKRLGYLALHCSANQGIYCIYQMIWLLRKYRNSQKLIHYKRKFKNLDLPEATTGEVVDDASVTNNKKKRKLASNNTQFQLEEEKDLLHNHAMESSLYELELLEQHYLYTSIGTAVTTLRNPETTSIHSIPPEMKQYANISLQSLIEKEFDDIKTYHYKDCALAYQKPTKLI